ncbi:hypothetical protein QYM36_009684 [Artemia franciscana]|uniref:Reverse transcriptase domain-containing protein n=1 Tax=Artemia franciscana TaxID=6661 RepID=A0AA88LA60_ARTSF|nr:hypothetical protein QYM36_009684 [Artemia franciscana]
MLAALLFLAVISYVITDFDERYKYVDDLSTLLEFFVHKSQTLPQLQGELKDSFTDHCGNNGLQINVNKTKLMRFNPLNRDAACPDPWFRTISTAIILGETFTAKGSPAAIFITL